MSSVPPEHKVVFVVGPTGVGKSEFAISACQEFTGKLVNCDSLQFYQGLNIGTAKPTPEEQKLVPHLLFDIVAMGGKITAGRFRDIALATIDKELSRSHLFFVGGSGFYIQALDKGMFDIGPVEPTIESEVRREIEEKGTQELYQELKKNDPVYAAAISANDKYRVCRAVCLLRTFRKSVTEIQKDFAAQAEESSLKVPKLKIGIQEERDVLRRRVRLRTQKMLASGLVAEVKNVLTQGYREWPPLKSVGYKETVSFIDGKINMIELEDEIVKNTMRFAKRQMTWFRRDSEIHWFQREDVMDKGLSFLREQLRNI